MIKNTKIKVLQKAFTEFIEIYEENEKNKTK